MGACGVSLGLFAIIVIAVTYIKPGFSDFCEKIDHPLCFHVTKHYTGDNCTIFCKPKREKSNECFGHGSLDYCLQGEDIQNIAEKLPQPIGNVYIERSPWEEGDERNIFKMRFPDKSVKTLIIINALFTRLPQNCIEGTVETLHFRNNLLLEQIHPKAFAKVNGLKKLAIRFSHPDLKIPALDLAQAVNFEELYLEGIKGIEKPELHQSLPTTNVTITVRGFYLHCDLDLRWAIEGHMGQEWNHMSMTCGSPKRYVGRDVTTLACPIISYCFNSFALGPLG